MPDPLEPSKMFLNMNKLSKSEEKMVKEAIREIFRKSPLLKGHAPPDKIETHFSKALRENLEDLLKADPTPEKMEAATKAIEKEYHGKKNRGHKK